MPDTLIKENVRMNNRAGAYNLIINKKTKLPPIRCPIWLKAAFEAYCYTRGRTMSGVIKEFMINVVKTDELQVNPENRFIQDEIRKLIRDEEHKKSGRPIKGDH